MCDPELNSRSETLCMCNCGPDEQMLPMLKRDLTHGRAYIKMLSQYTAYNGIVIFWLVKKKKVFISTTLQKQTRTACKNTFEFNSSQIISIMMYTVAHQLISDKTLQYRNAQICLNLETVPQKRSTDNIYFFEL